MLCISDNCVYLETNFSISEINAFLLLKLAFSKDLKSKLITLSMKPRSQCIFWRNAWSCSFVVFVSFTDKYTPNEYRQHFVLNYLKNEHLRLRTGLVQKRKNGEEYVTKKSITEQEPIIDKEYLAKFTELHPDVFADFKSKTFGKLSSLKGAVLDDTDAKEICEYLIEKLEKTPTGTAAASEYHKLSGMKMPWWGT